MRAAALQQIDNVAFLGDHPFQLNLRVALFEQLHQPIVMFGLVGIGKHHAQARFNLARQLNAQGIEPFAGREDRLHMPQYLAAGGGEHRLARAAIEQRQRQSASRLAMAVLTVDWLLRSLRAAAENEPRAAASTNACSASGE